jgi:transcriptional regulator with XRE-family HTH domain
MPLDQYYRCNERQQARGLHGLSGRKCCAKSQCRTVLGLSQKAKQIGVDPSTLARWEQREREPMGTAFPRYAGSKEAACRHFVCGSKRFRHGHIETKKIPLNVSTVLL